MSVKKNTLLKFVPLVFIGLAMANVAPAQSDAPKHGVVPQQNEEDVRGGVGAWKPKEIGDLKAWNTLTKSLTKENLKSAIIRGMYMNFKDYRGKIDGAEFDMGIARRFMDFRDQLKFSGKPLQIRDWHNERLYFSATLKDGTDIYVRMATGHVSVEDALAMGFKKEELDRIAHLTVTVNQVQDKIRMTKETAGLVENELGPMLEKLKKNEAYKNVQGDDVVIYRLTTGFITVDNKKSLYFAANDGPDDMIGTLIAEPLSRAPER